MAPEQVVGVVMLAYVLGYVIWASCREVQDSRDRLRRGGRP